MIKELRESKRESEPQTNGAAHSVKVKVNGANEAQIPEFVLRLWQLLIPQPLETSSATVSCFCP